MEVQWPLLVFGLLAGLGMGCLGFVSVSELMGRFKELRMPLLITALVCLAVGGLASALHMGNPGRVFYVLGNLGSGITQELLGTVAAGIAILALMIASFKDASKGVRYALAIFGLAAAIALPFITGKAYIWGARPAWDTWFLPIMYLGAAAAMGLFAAYVCAVIKRVDCKDEKAIGKATFAAVVVFGVTVALYLAGIATAPYQDQTRSLDRLISGDLGLLFWGVVVLAGLAAPMAISGARAFSAKCSEATASGTAFVVAGFICLLAGSAAIRMIMYLLGSSVQSFIY